MDCIIKEMIINKPMKLNYDVDFDLIGFHFDSIRCTLIYLFLLPQLALFHWGTSRILCIGFIWARNYIFVSLFIFII